MQRKKILIFAIGSFLILFVKFYVRTFLKVPPVFALVRDVAPNLLSAFIMPFGIDLFLKRWAPLVNNKALAQACLAGLLFLTCNELAQLFPVFRRTFDPYDILFSCFGMSLSFLVYKKWFLKSVSSYYDQQ